MATKTEEINNYSAANIQQRIKDLTEKRALELAAIKTKEDQARADLEAADKAIHAATERMDSKAYLKGKNERAEAEAALEMYSARYQQLFAEEFMSEEESDRVIDGLLAYEEKLAAEFEEAAGKILKQLSDLNDKYISDHMKTEETISSWTSQIHKNYRIFYGTKLAKGKTPDSFPVQVHITPYNGSGISSAINSFIRLQLISSLRKEK